MQRTRNSIGLLHISLALASVSGTWLSHGMYFVTQKRFLWERNENLLLSAGLGLTYVSGALTAKHVSMRFGRKRILLGIYGLLSVLSILIAFAHQPAIFVALMAMWTFLIAMNWPALEALLCHGRDAHATSVRTGAFNINWSITGAVAIAIVSQVVKISPSLVFYGVAVFTAISFLAVALFAEEKDAAHATLQAEPLLLAQRTLAKTLSRLALPASYTILYSLTPILASLPVVKSLPESRQSLVVSVWLAARFVVFSIMVSTTGWHTRPRLLLGAVLTVFGGFLIAALPMSTAWGVQLAQLIAGQALLGMAVGFVYYCSLYFGMVLSHAGNEAGGSTEQGGQHEALIGAGIILGPSLAAVASYSGLPAPLGASVVISLASAACGWVCCKHRVSAKE